jgi:hypothetical protein
MATVNLPFFYHLGSQLGALTRLPPDTSPKIDIIVATYGAKQNLEALLNSFPALNICRPVGGALLQMMNNLVSPATPAPPETDWSKPPEVSEFAYGAVIAKAKEFEIVLSAELQNIPTYLPEQKGIYDTTRLIEMTEYVLPMSVVPQLTSEERAELRQSGRCLAFDIPTACGFHMMRAVEAVLHRYYVEICKPTNPKRLNSWAAYISALHKINDPIVKEPDVLETETLIRQLKDRHRNLIIHPEVVLAPDEAFTLFEIGHTAIIAMAGRLPPLAPGVAASLMGTPGTPTP